MKKPEKIALLLLLASQICTAQYSDTLRISDGHALAKLATETHLSNTVILLEQVEYELPATAELQDSSKLNATPDSPDQFQPFLDFEEPFPDQGFTGWTFNNWEQVKIIGLGEQPVRILTANPDVVVMAFVNADDLILENLELGHAGPEKASCLGNVLQLKYCRNVGLEKCILFGSGAVGLDCDKSKKVVLRNSSIRDCTWGIAWINESESVEFQDCTFESNACRYQGFNISDTRDVRFTGCTMAQNCVGETRGRSLFYFQNGTAVLDNCQLKTNGGNQLTQSPESLSVLPNCTLSGNDF
jgi:hypothetical protein